MCFIIYFCCFIFRYNYENTRAYDDNFESASNYSNEIEKEETNCFPGDLLFTSSTNSSVKQPLDKIDTLDNNISMHQMSDIYSCLQNINCQIKGLAKKQKKIEDLVKKSNKVLILYFI